jgi:hypothetical protein
MRRFTYKGKYNPINTHKYVGNAKNVTYRSMWERRFMKYCDMNTNVLQWSSEELVIPYISPVDNRKHRYYPDFLLTVKDKDGNKKTMVIEVMKTWSVNEAKWKYATEFCKDKNWEFRILTEDFKALLNGS